MTCGCVTIVQRAGCLQRVSARRHDAKSLHVDGRLLCQPGLLHHPGQPVQPGPDRHPGHPEMAQQGALTPCVVSEAAPFLIFKLFS